MEKDKGISDFERKKTHLFSEMSESIGLHTLLKLRMYIKGNLVYF